MTAFIPDNRTSMVARVARLQTRLHLDAPNFVRFSLLNQEILVEGSVSSYEVKCKIDKVAQACGLQIQNCLRVIPGPAITPAIITEA